MAVSNDMFATMFQASASKKNDAISYHEIDDNFVRNLEVEKDGDAFDYKERKLIKCPEPYLFTKEMDSFENNRKKSLEWVRTAAKDPDFFKRRVIAETDGNAAIHTAQYGIKLRPGFRELARDQLKPVFLSEEKNGHLFLVGKAGSGKTELLLNIISGLTREYSPIELELYLSNLLLDDEVANALLPFTNLYDDCSEAKDILFLLDYLENCLKERQRLFSRIGVETLSEFSGVIGETDHLSICLARKFVIIDRFYAVYEEAGSSERKQMMEKISTIVANGAKYGIHLLLSSRTFDDRLYDMIQKYFSHQLIMRVNRNISLKLLEKEDAVRLQEGEFFVKGEEKDSSDAKWRGGHLDVTDISFITDVLKNRKKYYTKEDMCERISYEKVKKELKSDLRQLNSLSDKSLTFQQMNALNRHIIKLRSTLPYMEFRQGFQEIMMRMPERFEDEIMKASYKEEVLICPEPLTFMKDYGEESNRRDANDGEQRDVQGLMWEIFQEDLTNENRYRKINPYGNQDHLLWFNRTDTGINLRPGLMNNNRNNPFAVRMGDEMVHALVVGRTGAGKSVFLNNLIFNLLHEYAPWELDLFLIDFKKVEMSRYMSKGYTPHVVSCGATSEVRYVVSMLQYLVDCMNARQNFFSRLGVKNIAEFRKKAEEKFGVSVVLPRVLLLVDEFQQMFLEASSREGDRINDLLTAITKLGRATGYHLLFASQEMSQTLSGNVFANFKIRFALPCDSNISSTILGNKGASGISVGEVLLNTENGDETDNQLYKVPYIDDSVFDRTISKIIDAAKKSGFIKGQKYYQEDQQQKVQSLVRKIITMKSLRDHIIRESGGRYKDVIVLGDPVVYSHQRLDFESFFLESGKDKNILVASPNVSDLVYVHKLLAINFKYSPVRYRHILYAINPIMSNMYDMKKDMEPVQLAGIFHEISDLGKMEASYEHRKKVLQMIKKSNFNDAVYKRLILEDIAENGDVTVLESKMDAFFSGELEPPAGIQNMIQCYRRAKDISLGNVSEYTTIFDPMIIWVCGAEEVDNWRNADEILKGASDVNMLFVLFTSSADMDSFVRKTFDYLFVGGNSEQFYDRFGLNYTKKPMDSIVIDFKIRSLNITRAFKKTVVQFEVNQAPRITEQQLNEIFGEETG